MSETGGNLEQFINKVWYGKSWFSIVLLPLTVVFAFVAALRRLLYRRGVLASSRIPVPVIVVGNITVGGAGKTPATLWLANLLMSKGMHPAIISRGYGSKAVSQPVHVTADSDADQVGDEPVLLARRSGCPVFVDADRVRAANCAVSNGADVILSDDGLQHYRLQRDIEIAVVDGARGFGNGFLLPAGPLREPVSRLDSVDRILVQVAKDECGVQVDKRIPADKASRFSLAGELLRRVSDARTRDISELKGKSAHAVAGIANPDRFFEQLECYGIQLHRHPKPDHARLSEADVSFDDDLDVIVTEKDAVKCKSFAHERLWYLPVSMSFENSEDLRWFDALHDKLHSCRTQDSS